MHLSMFSIEFEINHTNLNKLASNPDANTQNNSSDQINISFVKRNSN